MSNQGCRCGGGGWKSGTWRGRGRGRACSLECLVGEGDKNNKLQTCMRDAKCV